MRTLPSADVAESPMPGGRRLGARRVALLMSALAAFLARTGAASIVVEGDDAFKQKVNTALQKIKGSDPAKKAKIEALESSGNKHKIKKTDVKKGSNNDVEDKASAGNASNGKGTGSVTQWEPNGTDKYDDDVNRDPTAALFHELVHACDKDKGMEGRGDVKGPDGEIDGDEVNAVTVENMYRMLAGLDLRAKYGGRRLPAAATTTTTTTSQTSSTSPVSSTSQTSTSTPVSTTTTSSMPGCASANLSVNPGNCGTVMSSPMGINCPPTCNASFSTSQSVQLSGQAPTSMFVGDCDTAGNVQMQNAHPPGCALTCACNAP